MKKLFIFVGSLASVAIPLAATSCYSTHLIRHENYYSLEEAYKAYTTGKTPKETQDKISHGAYESKWVYIRSVKGQAAPVKFKILSTQHVEEYMDSCMSELIRTHGGKLAKVISILLPKDTFDNYKREFGNEYKDIVEINAEMIPEHHIEWNYTIKFKDQTKYKFLYNLKDGIKNVKKL